MSHLVSDICGTIDAPSGAWTMPGSAFERRGRHHTNLAEQCCLPSQQTLDQEASAVLKAWLAQAQARRNTW